MPNPWCRAIINASLGDGCFWRHPQCVNWNIIWTSIHRPWLAWKLKNLSPSLSDCGNVVLYRKAGANGCFPNAKPLYGLKSHASPFITAGQSWSLSRVFSRMDMLDLAVWYLDDGCCVRRRDMLKRSFRISISVGAITERELFPRMRELLGTDDLGRVAKNNSRASERNLSWIIPKPAAVQILSVARRIAPPVMRYKTPVW